MEDKGVIPLGLGWNAALEAAEFIVLGLIMFAMGQVAERVFPWLVKMRIVVSFPG